MLKFDESSDDDDNKGKGATSDPDYDPGPFAEWLGGNNGRRPDKTGSFECKICGLVATSMEQYDRHRCGELSKKKRKLEQNNSSSNSTSSSSSSSGDSKETKEEERKEDKDGDKSGEPRRKRVRFARPSDEIKKETKQRNPTPVDGGLAYMEILELLPWLHEYSSWDKYWFSEDWVAKEFTSLIPPNEKANMYGIQLVRLNSHVDGSATTKGLEEENNNALSFACLAGKCGEVPRLIAKAIQQNIRLIVDYVKDKTVFVCVLQLVKEFLARKPCFSSLRTLHWGVIQAITDGQELVRAYVLVSLYCPSPEAIPKLNTSHPDEANMVFHR